VAENKSMNVYQRMLAIKSAIPTVSKNLTVDTGGGKSYKAVGEVDVLNAAKPLEEKYGIFVYPYAQRIVMSEFVEKEGYQGKKRIEAFFRLEVTYRFVNVDKPEEYIEVTAFGDGVDGGDKATGKAQTYAAKYARLKAYSMATGDDPDKDPSKPMSKPTITQLAVDEIESLIVSTETDRKKFTAFYGKDIPDFDSADYKDAKKKLKKKLNDMPVPVAKVSDLASGEQA
jgi:hypothetical protein